METDLAGPSGDDVYEVERILRKRYHPTKGVLYFVKWKHFPTSENTWEPACNFSQKLIDLYESSHKSKKQKLSTSKTSAKSELIGNTTNPTTSTTSLNASTSDEILPSSSSSLTSSCSSSAILTSVESQRNRGRPRKESISSRQSRLQSHIQQQKTHMAKPHLTVFNPVVEEMVYEPELTKEPIVVTDVTAKDLTVTISECRTPEGFFSA